MDRPRLCVLAGLGLSALLVSSCSGGPFAAAAGDPSTVAPPATPAPASSVTPPGASPVPSLVPCATETQAAIEETLDGQLAAFAARDYRAAFAFASESFRSGVDLDGFRRIITEGYPEVANATGREVVECLGFGTASVAARVDVTGANGRTVQLAYRFVLEPDGWHVDAASLLQRQAVETV